MEHLNRAMALIEEGLEGDVDVTALAREAMTSEHHFRRVFTVLAGMPLSAYIRRRRMTVATAAILAGEETVLAVALRYGYGSGDAFARAFRQLHGIGPEEARRPGAVLRSQPRMTFQLTIRGAADVAYRIIDKDAFRLVGVGARVPLVFEGPNEAIIAHERGIDPATRARLLAMSDQDPRGALGVSSGFEESRAEGTQLTYHHAVATSQPAPDDLDVIEVPALRWAVFTASGPMPESLQQLWPIAFGDFLPTQPYRLAPGPEIVRIQMADDGATADSELWLPIEPEETR